MSISCVSNPGRGFGIVGSAFFFCAEAEDARSSIMFLFAPGTRFIPRGFPVPLRGGGGLVLCSGSD